MKYMHQNTSQWTQTHRSLCHALRDVVYVFPPLTASWENRFWIWKRMQMIFGTCWHLQRLNHLYFYFHFLIDREWNVQVQTAVSVREGRCFNGNLSLCVCAVCVHCIWCVLPCARQTNKEHSHDSHHSHRISSLTASLFCAASQHKQNTAYGV